MKDLITAIFGVVGTVSILFNFPEYDAVALVILVSLLVSIYGLKVRFIVIPTLLVASCVTLIVALMT